MLVHLSPAFGRLAACLVLTLGAAAAAQSRRRSRRIAKLAAEKPFLDQQRNRYDQNDARYGVKPTGDIDRDFVDMMVPHHQGAIDMAKAILRYGHNEKIKRLAQEIIVTQQQEIAAMRLAVGEKLPPSMPSPTQVSARAPTPHHR